MTETHEPSAMMRFLKSIRRSRIRVGAALGVLALFVFVFAQPALAQLENTTLTEVALGGGLSTTTAPIIIARLIRAFLGTLGIIFTIVVLYAGWTIMVAQGNPDKIKSGKDMLKNGVIGMVICLSAFSITWYILSRLLDAAGAGGSVTAVTDAYSEPLSGSLGAGIIDSHYPERNALDVPRNTRIFITFNEAINPDSIISGYSASSAGSRATGLNAANVVIYPTASGETAALTEAEVVVTTVEGGDYTTFSFDPVPLLGSMLVDTNYTVALTNDIETEDGSAAFTGAYSGGYSWTFEVSTETDLTPPHVVGVFPRQDAEVARNVTIEITFNEAMDPVAATGTYVYGASGNFTNIETLDADGVHIDGTFAISNGYRTVEFISADACDRDPCGDVIYCLPASEDPVSVEAHAASLSGDGTSQALMVGTAFDGLVDAAANSLDGSGDGTAVGPPSDDYGWTFETTSQTNTDVPVIESMSAGINEAFVDNDATVDISFDIPMRSSTLNTTNISLWPDPWYEFWFTLTKTDVLDANGDVVSTTANIDHPTMVSPADLGWNYYPVVTRGVKSAYQICMFPAYGPSAYDDTDTFPAYGPSAYDDTDTSCRGNSALNDGVSEDEPYCCDGASSATACETSGVDSSGTAATVYGLPDTSE